jgi:hypothetical protein
MLIKRMRNWLHMRFPRFVKPAPGTAYWFPCDTMKPGDPWNGIGRFGGPR